MSSRIVLVTLALFILAACKTPSPESAVKASASQGEISLKDFSYNPDGTLLKELGSRLGCAKAARWIASPKGITIKASIKQVTESVEGSMYDRLVSEFLDRDFVKSECLKGGEPGRKSLTDGIKNLHQFVQNRYNSGLTMIMLSGFGAHVGEEITLDESVEEWDKLVDAMGDDSLRFWQIDCSNSFAPDERCAKEFVRVISEREEKYPPSHEHKFFLWGYSKGGNVLLEALRTSSWLRDKTIGALTAGAPIGGSSTVVMYNPLFQSLANKIAKTTQVAVDFANKSPFAYLMTPLQHFVDSEDVKVKIAKLLTPEESQAIGAGAEQMLPENKLRYLREKFSNANFARSDGTAIKVFHASSIVDLATMNPFPLFTVKNNKIAVLKGSFSSDHLGEIVFSPIMTDFPFNDTCVPLEFSVIPKAFVPQGLDTEMIGLFSYDHATFRLTPLLNSTWDVPHLAIVDSLIDAMANKLKGGA